MIPRGAIREIPSNVNLGGEFGLSLIYLLTAGRLLGWELYLFIPSLADVGTGSPREYSVYP